jgi:2-C-methyl-D-erythritol 4-phosphate cytidylyltransferase/2-C-methyl-D-erythritol 2,4-cyclodiphosphate synthase
VTVTALIVAAGKGERLGGDVPKQFRLIGGKPVLRWAVEALLHHPRLDAVRVVIGEGQESLAEDALSGLDIGEFIIGGATRRESSRNGLLALSANGRPQSVLIHDAARPFVPPAVVDRLLAKLQAYEGAIPALPIADTLVQFDGIIGDTVPRENLFRVQTPQAFVFEAVVAAHRLWPADQDATDDAQMVRDTGHEITIVTGDPLLDKLTTQADWDRAEAVISSRMIPRTGMGFDVHGFSGEGPIMLGGIAVPHSRGLAGHSDADVILHSITDALLGAAGLGDIGEHFPPSDPQWKGASSDRFLLHAAELVRQRGGTIDHVDCTIIAEEPKVGPHRSAMRERIAAILGLGIDQVSIKATTTEGLGFTGRREGIAAQAVASIRMMPNA